MLAATLLSMLLPLAGALVSGQEAEPAAEQPFISRTHVIAPRKVGEFLLEGTSYDPGNRLAGVGARYTHPQHPETRFDVYVYPAGQMEPGVALSQGMKAFLESIEYASGPGGSYQDLNVLERNPFALEPDADMKIEFGENLDDPLVKEILTGAVTSPRQAIIPGERLKLSMTHARSQMPLRSRGYLFYRQLYYFKGRISVAEDYMDEAAFDTVADEAMRTLIPAISALNVGSCATIHVAVDESEDEDMAAEAGVRALIQGLARVQASNCTGEATDDRLAELAKDAEIVTIEFNPGEWSAQ